MISEVFEMEKASACGCRQKEPRVSPLTEGSERLFFLLWQKSPYMWYTDREQKYKNMFWTDCEQTSCYFTEGRVRHCGNKGKTAAAEGIRM